MIKVSKKQRKLLRSLWRLPKARKQSQHSRRIDNAMQRGARRR